MVVFFWFTFSVKLFFLVWIFQKKVSAASDGRCTAQYAGRWGAVKRKPTAFSFFWYFSLVLVKCEYTAALPLEARHFTGNWSLSVTGIYSNALHTLQRIIISLYSLWSICTDFEMYRLKTVFFYFFLLTLAPFCTAVILKPLLKSLVCFPFGVLHCKSITFKHYCLFWRISVNTLSIRIIMNVAILSKHLTF